jgi:hypothetical protein
MQNITNKKRSRVKTKIKRSKLHQKYKKIIKTSSLNKVTPSKQVGAMPLNLDYYSSTEGVYTSY